MQGKEEDEGILSYVEDDDAAICGYAHRTFAVIFLECYKYGVKSNRENGEGRTDVTVKDIEHVCAAVFEFKIAETPDKLEERAYDAIKQIGEKGYAKQLAYDGYREIIKIGIGYFKKRCVVKIEKSLNIDKFRT